VIPAFLCFTIEISGSPWTAAPESRRPHATDVLIVAKKAS
jgi:hypothetical protein